MLPIEQQTVKVTAAEAALKADNNTELQLRWCFQRRGDALDRCRLVEWGLHQRWVQYLLGSLSKPAPDGYAKIKLDVSIPVPVHATGNQRLHPLVLQPPTVVARMVRKHKEKYAKRGSRASVPKHSVPRD